jgi:hypothetical protein
MVRKQLLRRSLQTKLKKDNAEMETEGDGRAGSNGMLL